jgi:CBS domain-containing protein
MKSSGKAERAKPEDTVSNVMTKKVLTLEPSKKISDALKMMIEEDIGSVLVARNGRVEGIITERDIVRDLPVSEKAFSAFVSTPLSRAAKKSVVTIEPDLEIWEAFALMLENKIRRLPVVSDGKLAGIVTERDLFKWVVKVAFEPNLPEKLKKLL